LADEEKHELLESVEQRAKATRTPLRSWESAMERPVSLLVVPIFAFLNAGIVLSAEMFRAMALSPMSWGVIAGLVISKPLGIVFMSWLALKLGWGGLPEEVGLAHLLGLGLLWPAWASPCRYLSPSSASTISWSF
jgi:NhaA family Na+:H+ antiporter